jgi:N-acetylmuramoyl-L-alanine amidase
MAKDPDPNIHVVEPGDRLSRIAFIHGHASVAAIWDAPENQALRARRKNPEILMPGDRVFLPPTTAEAHAAPEQSETRLEHVEIPSELRVKLVFDGEPIVPRGKVWVRIDTDPYSPKAPYESEVTLAGGAARFHVDPRVTEVTLISEDPAFSLRLLVGHLQPVDEPTGVGLEQRLSNLGFHCPAALPPGKSDKAVKAHAIEKAHASARFQAAFDVAPRPTALEKLGQP